MDTQISEPLGEDEIAKLLSGINIDPNNMKTAEELLAELAETTDETVAGAEEIVSIDASSTDIEEREIEEVAADIEMEAMKAEIYEQAESTSEMTTEPEAIEAAAEPAKPGRKAKAPKTPKTSTAVSTKSVAQKLEDLPAENFVLSHNTDTNNLEANKAAVLAKRPSQVKIAEKFDNALMAAAAGKKPSTFIVDCFAALNARKSITSTELVAVLQSHEYSEGTARSQAGQIMALFPVLGIADRAGQTITLREDSTLADWLRSL